MRLMLSILLFGLAVTDAQSGERSFPSPATDASARRKDPDAVQFEIKKSELQGFKVYAPDRKRFLINKEDAKGVAQVYVGSDGNSILTCITDTQQTDGPKPERFKMQPHWHPSGKWIFMAVERDEYTTPPILGSDRKFVEGMLQCGLWTNMYAVSPDGKQWHRLTDYKSGVMGIADGYTGPVFTPDGTKAVFSQVVDGNIFAYWPFGKWDLILADVEFKDGVPYFPRVKNITPEGMHWNEPGNFSPDGVSVLLSGSTEKDQQGMDQYILNINTLALKNLTNSPTVWDEHGCFSPDGESIIFMSAHPYRSDPSASKTLTIRTEFMLMDKNGGGLTQLTHFKERGHAQYSDGTAACVEWHPDGKSATLSTLVFPDYEYWDLKFLPRQDRRGRK